MNSDLYTQGYLAPLKTQIIAGLISEGVPHLTIKFDTHQYFGHLVRTDIEQVAPVGDTLRSKIREFIVTLCQNKSCLSDISVWGSVEFNSEEDAVNTEINRITNIPFRTNLSI